MDDNCIFNCEVCGREEEAKRECPPECCGKPMAEKEGELPVCQTASDSEHARFDENFGEPCDDGRSGKV